MAEKVIIVTGASRGIGLAIARYLLTHKTNVVVVARSKEPLSKLHEEFPGQVQILSGDLADFTLGQKTVDFALSTWSRIDGLIVNHGVLDPVKRISDAEPEEWRKSFDVNVFSAISMIKAALPSLRHSRGTIILTSSGAASSAYSTWGAYGASKSVLNHVAKTLSVEEPDVTTLAIRPGVVDTEMQREIRDNHENSMDAKDYAKFSGLKSSGGLLKPEQPGNVMARIALSGPKSLSGQYFSWDDEKLAQYQN